MKLDLRSFIGLWSVKFENDQNRKLRHAKNCVCSIFAFNHVSVSGNICLQRHRWNIIDRIKKKGQTSYWQNKKSGETETNNIHTIWIRKALHTRNWDEKTFLIGSWKCVGRRKFTWRWRWAQFENSMLKIFPAQISLFKPVKPLYSIYSINYYQLSSWIWVRGTFSMLFNTWGELE